MLRVFSSSRVNMSLHSTSLLSSASIRRSTAPSPLKCSRSVESDVCRYCSASSAA